VTIQELLASREVLPPIGWANECVVWAEHRGVVRALADCDVFLAQGGASADVFSILAAIARATEPEIPDSMRSTQYFPTRFIHMDPVFRILRAAQ